MTKIKDIRFGLIMAGFLFTLSLYALLSAGVFLHGRAKEYCLEKEEEYKEEAAGWLESKIVSSNPIYFLSASEKGKEATRKAERMHRTYFIRSSLFVFYRHNCVYELHFKKNNTKASFSLRLIYSTACFLVSNFELPDT